jgi:hypothetical protein
MILRLFWVTLLSIPLLSCSMNGQDSLQLNNDIFAKADKRMAGARGVNLKIIDRRLNEMVHQAGDIEVQIASLMTRLNNLRDDIATYDQPMTPHDDTPAAVAIKQPEIILPVLEKPLIANATKPKPLKKNATPKLKSMPNTKGVYGVRVGIHADKTRLVFDINGATQHTFDFDAEAGLLTISLPQTPWTTRQNQMFKASQITGYDANAQGQGSVIAMAIKNTSSVKTSVIAKTKSKPARLIVDLIK